MKPIYVGHGYKTYRLTARLMEQVDGKTHRLSDGPYTVLPEMRSTLKAIQDYVPPTENTTQKTPFLNTFVGKSRIERGASYSNGALTFGCTKFSQPDSKKIMKWAGVAL